VVEEERTTDHGQTTGKLFHLRLWNECTLFCNLQSQARTHAVLVIDLYELLGNSTQYFSYTAVVSFIGGGNRSTRRKPSTCRKSLTNFIWQCFIRYTSQWTGFEVTTLVVIGTDCEIYLDGKHLLLS
jgi:hypothetical protein